MEGKEIRLWRWKHHMTQQALAEHLGVKWVGTIKRWEGGQQAAPEYLRLALERIEQLLATEEVAF